LNKEKTLVIDSFTSCPGFPPSLISFSNTGVSFCSFSPEAWTVSPIFCPFCLEALARIAETSRTWSENLGEFVSLNLATASLRFC